jgi:hypothetical protein
MNCKEARELLAAYLDDEVPPAQQALLQNHLSGCPDCQAEMKALWVLQAHVKRSLDAEAARVAPPPDAWERLQARMAADALPAARQWLPHRSTRMRNRYALAFVGVMAVILAFALVAFVQPVRAGVAMLFNQFFRFGISGGGEAVVSGSFVPLTPGYIPEGFYATHVAQGADAGGEFIEMRFFNGSEFVIIYEEMAGDDVSLPEGSPATVNGHSAVLLTGLTGTAQLQSPLPQEGREAPMMGGGGGGGGGGGAGGSGEPQPVPETLDYTDGCRLVWTQDGLTIDILTNLPEDELSRIAGSMTLAEEIPAEEAPTIPPTPEVWGAGPEIPGNAASVTMDESLTFTALEPVYQPADFYARFDLMVIDETGAQIREVRLYGNERFAILVEQMAQGEADLGAGEPVMIGEREAMLVTGLAGTAQLTRPWLQDGRGSIGALSTAQSGQTPPDGVEPLFPDTIGYEDGLRLTWVVDGIRIEMLTNLPYEEALQVAAELTPSTYGE